MQLIGRVLGAVQGSIPASSIKSVMLSLRHDMILLFYERMIERKR